MAKKYTSEARRLQPFIANVGANVSTDIADAKIAAHAALPDVHHTRVAIGNGGLSAHLAITSGQVLTLSDINHSEIANISPDDHHNPVTPGNAAITVSTQVVSLALAANSGLQISSGLAMGSPVTLSSTTISEVSGSTHSHAIIAYSDSTLGGQAGHILKSDGSGDVKLHKMTLTDRLTGQLVDSPAGTSLQLAPAQDLNLSPVSNQVRLTSAVRIQSDNYVSQTTGWGISYAGGGDFRYLFADELHARTFYADLEAIRAGVHGVFPSGSVLSADFTVPAAGATATLVVDTFKGFDSFRVFQDGEIVNVRQFSRASNSLTITNCWGTVTWQSTDTTAHTQSYTFTRSTGSNAGAATAGTVIGAGVAVPDYGFTNNGFIESNAIDGLRNQNSPYTQTVTWTTHPASGQTVNTRTGNLYGIFAHAGEFGLYAGDGVTDSSHYLRLSSYAAEAHNLPIRLYSGSSEVIGLEPGTNPYLAIGSPIPIGWMSQSGVWAGRHTDGTYRWYVGEVSGGALAAGASWDGSKLRVVGSQVIGPGVGYVTGDVTLSCSFDGPPAYKTDFQVNVNGHLGQPGSVTGGVIGRQGKFGKALQIAEASTNYCGNPRAEINTGWWQVCEYTRYTGDSHIGAACYRSTGGIDWTDLATPALTATNSQDWVISLWYKLDNGDWAYTYKVFTTQSSGVTRVQFNPYTNAANEFHIKAYTNIGTLGEPIIGSFTSQVLIDEIQIEQKSYATPYLDGSLGNGHSWASTAHASSSSRTVAGVQYYTVGNLDFNNPGAISFWFFDRHYFLTYYPVIFQIWYNANNYFSIVTNHLGTSQYRPYMDGKIGGTYFSTTRSVDTSYGWNHVLFTWNPGDHVYCYVNGQLSGSAAIASGFTHATMFSVGSQPGGTNSSNTLIDDLVIFNKMITADDAAVIYASNAPIQIMTNKFELMLTGDSVGKIWGYSGGLFGKAASGYDTFAFSTGAVTSWGGITNLSDGDIILGNLQTSTSNALYIPASGPIHIYTYGAAGDLEISSSGIDSGRWRLWTDFSDEWLELLVTSSGTGGLLFSSSSLDGSGDVANLFGSWGGGGSYYLTLTMPTHTGDSLRLLKFTTGTDTNGKTQMQTQLVMLDSSGNEPTGGAKGVGTINAKGVYDDNTLLTDYVFEPAYHLPSIGEMREFYEANKHLPTIPGRDEWERKGSFSLGELASHLWETVEVQARYIGDLELRIAALEAIEQ